MDKARRLYNLIDGLFDRRSLGEVIQLSRAAGSRNNFVTARQAFALCAGAAAEFDRKASLKLLVSADGSIRPDGTSQRWEFFFDLPRRRAQMYCAWYLPWSEEADDLAEPLLEVMVKPFPPADSPLRKMVQEGKLLRRQLAGMWEAEHGRRAALPHRFRDSDEVMRELAGRGLDVTQTEVTLRAECDRDQRPLWIAEGRNVSFRTNFT